MGGCWRSHDGLPSFPEYVTAIYSVIPWKTDGKDVVTVVWQYLHTLREIKSSLSVDNKCKHPNPRHIGRIKNSVFLFIDKE